MSHAGRLRPTLLAAAVLVIVMPGPRSGAQYMPYGQVPGWAKLPSGMKWGGVAAAGIGFDAQGNLWVVHRGEPGILKFDSSGKFLKGFAEGMFKGAHGGFVDREGNIWAGSRGGINQVFKFSQEGKLLMTLGAKGVSRNSPDAFISPTDVAVAPNGDIFVTDGHRERDQDEMLGGDRVMKFSKEGKFIKSVGTNGSRPGQFMGPHCVVFDSKGRLFVCDRNNNRIQILDQDLNVLDVWKQFSKPSDIFITKNDKIYVVDNESNPDVLDRPRGKGDNELRANPGWPIGVRIGDASTGMVFAFQPGRRYWESVTVDAQGAMYVGEPGIYPDDFEGKVQKYLRRW